MTLNRNTTMTDAPVTLNVPAQFASGSPGAWQTIKDAFVQENPVVSAINYAANYRAPVVGGTRFDPFDDIEGTVFEQYPEKLINVNTPEEKLQAESELMEELQRRERLRNSGAFGIAAQLAAGFLDPLILLPVAGQVRGGFKAAKITKGVVDASRVAKVAQLGKIAVTGTRSAAQVTPLTHGIVTARSALFGSTASELALQATQDTRTLGESALNVASATVLSGFLGSAIGFASRRSRLKALEQIDEALSFGTDDPKGIAGVRLTEQDLVVPTDGTPSGAEIKLANAWGWEYVSTVKGAKAVIDPFTRTMALSQSESAKRTVLQLVNPTLETKGLVTGSTVEAEINASDGLRYQLYSAGDELYTKYRVRMAKERGAKPLFVKEGGRVRAGMIDAADRLTRRNEGTDVLSKNEFMREAGLSWRSEGGSAHPEMTEMAKKWDDLVYGPMLDDMIELGMLPEEVKSMGPTGARRFLSRVYNQDKLIADEAVFKSEKIRPWLLSKLEPGEVDEILKNAGLEPAAKGGDSALDGLTPVQRAAVDEAIDHGVYDIFENMTKGTRGRIAYSADRTSAASALKPRALTWDDAFVADYLENHLEVLGDRYMRTVVPDVALTRQFGSVDLKAQFDEIAKDYAARRAAAKTPAARAKIQKLHADDRKQIEGMLSLLRGTYNVPSDSAASTAFRGMKLINFLSMGGGFGLNAVPDVGMPVLRNGLIRSFGTGYLPYIARLKAAKLSTAEARLFGAAVDLHVDTRSKIFSDIGDEIAANRAQEIFQQVGRKFSIANLQAPWNAEMKGIVSNISMTRMIKAILKEGKGKISAKELKNLEHAHLTAPIRARIRAQLAKPDGMHKSGPLSWSNTAAWDDLVAKQEWGRAVRLTVDNTIVTPGAGAAPLWLSSEMGGVIFQFQRFSYAATQQVLFASLQNLNSVSTYTGLATLVGMGMLVEATKNKINDRQNPDSLSDWVKAGIDRSGAIGVYGNIYNTASRAVGADALSSRFAARNLVSSLAGPTAGTAESLSRLAITGSKGEFTDSDLNTLRRLIPFNQIPYLQSGFDAIEEGTARALQLPRKRVRRRGTRR